MRSIKSEMAERDDEVAGIQPVDFRIRKIFEIGLAALACEEDVVLTPKNDGLRLLLFVHYSGNPALSKPSHT
jgi:hypothetical protein